MFAPIIGEIQKNFQVEFLPEMAEHFKPELFDIGYCDLLKQVQKELKAYFNCFENKKDATDSIFDQEKQKLAKDGWSEHFINIQNLTVKILKLTIPRLNCATPNEYYAVSKLAYFILSLAFFSREKLAEEDMKNVFEIIRKLKTEHIWFF